MIDEEEREGDGLVVAIRVTARNGLMESSPQKTREVKASEKADGLSRGIQGGRTHTPLALGGSLSSGERERRCAKGQPRTGQTLKAEIVAAFEWRQKRHELEGRVTSDDCPFLAFLTLGLDVVVTPNLHRQTESV